MLKKLLFLTLIIALITGQDFNAINPQVQSAVVEQQQAAENPPLSAGDEYVVDYDLPFAKNFIAASAVAQESTPQFEVSTPIAVLPEIITEVQQVWDNNVPRFNSFQELFDFQVSHVDSKLTDLNQELQVKQGQCSELQESVDALTKGLNQIDGFILWISDRIASNAVQTQEVYDQRCKAHMAYLSFMKNTQITQRLLAFLKSALENYSFVQIKSVGEILSKYSNSKMNNEEVMKLMLVELKQVQERTRQRTAEEIGTKHVDSGGDFKVAEYDYTQEDLAAYKSQIFQIISTLENDLLAEVERRQNDEVVLNEGVFEWTSNLAVETAELQRHLEEQQATRLTTAEELAVDQYALDTCKADQQYQEDQIAALEAYKAGLYNNRAEIEAAYTVERNKWVLSATMAANPDYVPSVHFDDQPITVLSGALTLDGAPTTTVLSGALTLDGAPTPTVVQSAAYEKR